jgi:hypothetical protein
MNLEKVLIYLMSIFLHFGGKNNIKHMRYIYREEHMVYVDYEIKLDDIKLAENGVNPYDDLEISQYIKDNFLKLQKESTEWWISAQENNFERKVGERPEGDDSENSIRWIE